MTRDLATLEGSLGEVPFVSLGRQHAALATQLRSAFDRVLASSAFILGEEVERFEDAFAAFCGVRTCVGVSSGTAALRLLFEAAGVGPGDEVILPGHTFIASALAVVQAGATPVLCDVEPDTGLMDVASAASLVGPRTAALLPVHLYGQLCDMAAVERLAKSHGLLVVEDAAQAHGAEWRGRRAGSGTAGAAYSFYPSKNLGALGDGGAVCTDDDALAERVRRLRNLGQRVKGEHLLPGYNDRLDGLQAAVLSEKLPHLDRWNAQRRGHAAAYRADLQRLVRLLAERPHTPCTYHVFPVRVPERERVAAELARRGVRSGVHYHPAVHVQPIWNGDAPRHAGLANAEAWAREELSLPMFPELTGEEVARVLDACEEVFEK